MANPSHSEMRFHSLLLFIQVDPLFFVFLFSLNGAFPVHSLCSHHICSRFSSDRCVLVRMFFKLFHSSIAHKCFILIVNDFHQMLKKNGS